MPRTFLGNGCGVWKAEDIGHVAAELRDIEVMRGVSTRHHGGVRLVIRGARQRFQRVDEF